MCFFFVVHGRHLICKLHLIFNHQARLIRIMCELEEPKAALPMGPGRGLEDQLPIVVWTSWAGDFPGVLRLFQVNVGDDELAIYIGMTIS